MLSLFSLIAVIRTLLPRPCLLVRLNCCTSEDTFDEIQVTMSCGDDDVIENISEYIDHLDSDEAPAIGESELCVTDEEDEATESRSSYLERRENNKINRISYGLVLGHGSDVWKRSIKHLWLADRDKGIYLDCRIVCSDQVILNGDRVILMASSGYFRSLLSLHTVNTEVNYYSSSSSSTERFDVDQVTHDSPLIVNINVPSDIMKFILDFIFTREIASDLPFNLLRDFIQSCIDLQIYSALRSICSWISCKANEINFLDLWKLSVTFKLPSIIAIHRVALICFEKIPDDVFVKLSFNGLRFIVSHDRLNVRREETTMRRIITWTRDNVIDREKYFLPLVQLVRFGNAAVNFIPQLITDNSFKSFAAPQVVTYLYHVHSVLMDIQADPVPLKYDITRHPFLRPRIPHEILFVFGGWCGFAPVANFESYDIRVNKWFSSQINGMSPRAYHGTVTLQDAIYIIGGFSGTVHLNTVVAIDPINRNWYTRANMIQSRCYVSVATLDGKIYACGGFNGLQRTNACEVYDPNTNEWTLIKSMNDVRSDATCIAHQGKLYVIGGFDGENVHRSGEVYDPKSDSWSYIESMSIARSGLSSVCWNDLFIVVGGNNGVSRESSVEIYSPLTDKWSSGPRLITSRSNFAAAILEDNLYVIGGFDGESTTDLCEKLSLKDLYESQWTPVWSLPKTRSALSACVMADLPNALEFSWLRKEGRTGGR